MAITAEQGAAPTADVQTEPDAHDGKDIALAVSDGYKALEWARKQRDQAREQLVGHRYEKDSLPEGTQRAAINLIAQTVITLLPSLFPQEIKHAITTTDPRLEFEGIVLSADLDHRAKEEDLAETVQRIGVDALLSPFGIAVTRLKAGPDRVKINGNLYDNGAFYTAYVDIDDYAMDDCCKRRGEARWEAIRWRASVDELKASGIFDPEQIDKLPQYETSSGQDRGKHELVKTVQCWDVYMYHGTHTRCVTIGGNFCNNGDPTSGATILADYTYEGPGQSPIRWLCFYEVPGKAIPLPPVFLWRELHDALAKIGDKMVMSILEAKTVIGYRPTAVDDAKAVQHARHLETIKMNDPDGLKVHSIKSIDREFYEGFGFINQRASEAAGNIRQEAGLESEADTATAASILSANSDKRTRWMRSRVQKFLSQIAADRAWYVIKDPLINKLTGVRMPGGEMLSVRYTAEDREGDALDFQYDVVPFEPESGDPNVRLKRITELLATVLPAVFPLIQAGLIDVQGLVRLISREYGNQDFDQVIAGSPQLQMRIAAIRQMAGQPQPGQVEQPGQPAMPSDNQTTPIGAIRSAMAPGVPS